MRLSACLETLWTGEPWPERVRRAARHGVDAVEFWDWREKPLQALAEACRQAGLAILAFSGQRRGSLVDPLQREVYLQEIEEACRAAGSVGCRHLVLTANALDPAGRVLNPAHHLAEGVKSLHALQTLREAVRIAERAGTVLLLEALNTRRDHPGCDLSSGDVAAALVEEVASPHLKLLLDIYHRQVMEGDLIAFIHRWGPWIGHVHVADVPGRHEPGTGEIAWGQVVRALAGRAPDACAGLECIPAMDSDAAVAAFCRIFKGGPGPSAEATGLRPAEA